VRLLRAIRTVLWGLLGIRRGADATRDAELKPRTIAAAAIVLIAVVIGSIATGVHVITGKHGAQQRAPAAAPVAQPKLHGPVVVRDTMEERTRPCTGCHGGTTQATKDGFSPRIAGKPAGYLFNQLASFRDGRRTYAPMVYLVQYMTDDYLREMAEYFSRLRASPAHWMRRRRRVPRRSCGRAIRRAACRPAPRAMAPTWPATTRRSPGCRDCRAST
jgi:cytochrome c553